MYWYKLNKSNKYRLCSPRTSNGNVGLLDELIEKYNLVEFRYIERQCPIMYALNYGNFKLKYSYSLFETRKPIGGFKNPESIYNHPFLDHAYAFRTADKKIYYVTNPYLSDAEINAILSPLVNCNDANFKDTYGDFSKLKYDILGKDKSYYNPGATNIVVMYI